MLLFIRHGHLNALKSKVKFLDADPEYDAVLALENAKDVYRNEKKGRECFPAPILKQRTLRPTVRPESAETVEDAFMISMGYRNMVNLPFMGSLLSREGDLDGIKEELVARALAFEDPFGGEILPAANYLSGNVRKKLKEARIANEHELAATGYGRYLKNVEALEPLVPREKVMGEFKAKLGATWVPVHLYERFASSILGGRVDIRYRKADDRFAVEPTGCQYASQNLNDYGYSGRRGHEIFKLILNQQPLVHEDLIKNPDGAITRVYNPEKTALLRQVANRIAQEWEAHITSDEKVAHELTRIYNERFNSHRAPVYDGGYLPLPGLSGAVRRTTHQLSAVSRNLQERCGLLAHDVGYGKAQPLSARILTPSGWKYIGDMKVGDRVIAGDGSVTRIDGVFPQGEKEIFRVMFSDGSVTECCEEHLWLTQTYAERSYATKALQSFGSIDRWQCAHPKVRSLSEIRKTLKGRILKGREVRNHSIPIVGTVQFDSQPVPLHPYVLGILLGDGCFRARTPALLSCGDAEIVAKCNNVLDEGLEFRRPAHEERCPTYPLHDSQRKTWRKGRIAQALEELGLSGIRSRDKFIPSVYLFNSPGVRIDLLQGLMDTDGWVASSGHTSYFTSSSQKLAADVRSLVQSIGGTVSVSIKVPGYNYNGQTKHGLLSYTLSIRLPRHINPFSLDRKRTRAIEKQKYKPCRFIERIEPIGRKLAQCISIEHPSHLYVTDDFIVTHNTFTKIITCMELRRLGLARKPMIVVENSTIGQYAASFRTAYPQANILVANEKNFAKQNRRRFIGAIATHDWDAIIIAQSQFDLLPNSVKMIETFSAEQLEAYKEVLLDAQAEGDRIQIRRARQALISLEKKIEKQVENLQKRQDNMLAFDQLGVDFLFIDEIHRYKKIPYSTKLGRIKGVDLTVSQRGLNLAMKSRWLHEQHEGRHVIGATGTPVSNTLAESWNMLRLTRPAMLNEFGVETFDRFASAFCMQKTAPELNESTNTWRIVTRMSEFINGDGLRSLIRSGWDVQMDPVAINLKLPALRTGKPISVTMPITAPVEEIMNRIAETYDRWEEMDSKDRLAYSYVPLVLMQYGLAGSLEPRLADPTLPDDPNSLVNKAVEQVVREYHAHAGSNAAQLVFADSYRPISITSLGTLMDVTIEDGDGRVDGQEDESEEEDAPKSEMKPETSGYNLYFDIRDKLSRKGIPAHQIAIVNEYSSRADKKALFDRVNSGDIRVLLGSTHKMGVGVNVQERLVAIHELAPPRDMTPASSRQRRGRIVRQGNTFDEVAVYQYGMENTTVAGVFHRIERKEKSIVQILMGYDESQSFEDPASELLRSSAELKALCARDDRVLRKVELEEQIRTLAAERNAFAQKKYRDKETLSQHQSHQSWLKDFNEILRGALFNIGEALQKKYQRPRNPEPEPVQGDLPPVAASAPETKGQTDVYKEEENLCMEIADEKGCVLVVEREELINAIEALLQKAIDRSKARGNLDRGVTFTLNGIPMRVKLESISTLRTNAKFSLETFQPGHVIRSGEEINKTAITTPQGVLRSFRNLPLHLSKSAAENQITIHRLDQNILTLQKIIAETPVEWTRANEYIALSRELDEIDAVLTKEAAKRREERREKRQKASGLPAAAENCRITHADSQDTLERGSQTNHGRFRKAQRFGVTIHKV